SDLDKFEAKSKVSSAAHTKHMDEAGKSSQGFRGMVENALSRVGISHDQAEKVTERWKGTTSSAFGKVGADASGMSNLAKDALTVGVVGGVAVAGAAIGKFALDSASKFAGLTAEVRQFQRVSLTSAEDASQLVFTIKRLGIEPEAASKAVGMLSKN